MLKVTCKNTVSVTKALAAEFGTIASEEKRAGTWGFTIGNMWATTRKELHAKALEMLECGAGKNADWEDRLKAQCYSTMKSYDVRMFEAA